MYHGKYAAPAKASRKRKVRWGTVVFYLFYLLFVAAALCAIFQIMVPLRGWLETYQASQPENKSQEIFDRLFQNPDWEAIYDLAGVEDTVYEGSGAYRAYMEDKVSKGTLTFLKTSAGLSDDRKYVVRCGDEKIAAFTMTGTEDPNTRITDWELGTVEVMFRREQSVTVETAADQTVYINGVPLDESHIIQSTDTLAEEYLPEGIHGYRTRVLRLEGLLAAPQVTVKNADGTEASVTLGENGIYTAGYELPQITGEERQIAAEAAKAQALFAIRAVPRSKLRQHFDSNSQLYNDIVTTEVFMQEYKRYSIDEDSVTVSDFYRYSEDLFSAHVALKLNVTRTNDTVKTYEAANTYFFARQADGTFLVNDMTNLRIQETRIQVRLTFMTAEPTSVTVAADSRRLTLPEVAVPQGKTFRGWARKETDGEGRQVMTILFIPDEQGNVALNGTPLLEPMTLYPVFE